MAVTLNDKKAVVAEVAEVATSATSLVAAEYRGLTVSEMTDLRKQARDAGVYLRVVRNTLAKRAVEGTSFDCVKPILTGPLFLAFSQEEPGTAARLLKKFAKDHDKLIVKALSLDGKLLDAKDLDAVASLPTRDEALAKLMFVMKAPVEKFVRTLAEPHAKLVRTLAAVRDKRQSEQ